MKKLIALVLAVLMLSAMALSVSAIALPTRGNYYNPTLVFNTFWRKYQIENIVEGEGVTTTSAKIATTGDVITVTAAPAEGWKLAELKVVDALGREVEVKAAGEGVYTFVMPAVKATVSTTYKEYTTIELGQSALTVLTDGFELDMESAFEDANDVYLIAYYINAETNMDFDVYEWAKEEGVTLEDAVLEESDEYTLTEINGYAVAVYTSVDEFDGVEYNTVTYIIDAGEIFEEVVFYLDVEGAAAVAEAMMATLA